jgi:hypothetical protein
MEAVAAAACNAAACLEEAGGSAATAMQRVQLAVQLREAAACLDFSLAAIDASGRLEAAKHSAAIAVELAIEVKPLLQQTKEAAALLHTFWQLPEQVAAARLEVAQVAATRSCAYLGCSNLGMSGGLGAGQGVGSKLCSGCRVAWYCGAECSHADWRQGGHRRVCKALGAARQEQEQTQEA